MRILPRAISIFLLVLLIAIYSGAAGLIIVGFFGRGYYLTSLLAFALALLLLILLVTAMSDLVFLFQTERLHRRAREEQLAPANEAAEVYLEAILSERGVEYIAGFPGVLKPNWQDYYRAYLCLVEAEQMKPARLYLREAVELASRTADAGKNE